jgi:hypothetical protein
VLLASIGSQTTLPSLFDGQRAGYETTCSTSANCLVRSTQAERSFVHNTSQRALRGTHVRNKPTRWPACITGCERYQSACNCFCCRNDAKEWITEGSVQSLANLQRSERDNEVYDKFLDKVGRLVGRTQRKLFHQVFFLAILMLWAASPSCSLPQLKKEYASTTGPYKCSRTSTISIGIALRVFICTWYCLLQTI